MKKNEKYNLEKKRQLFFWIGMIMSLLVVISAFEWRSKYDTRIMKNFKIVDPYDDWTAPVKPEEPRPPKPKKVVISPVIEVVKNDEKFDDLHIIIDIEDLADETLDSLIGDMTEDVDNNVYFGGVIESPPEPIGGIANFYKFISTNIRYPRAAQQLGIEGRVFVQFIIDKNGKLTSLEVIRGIGGGCDAEALRVLSLAPAWIPGKQRAKPVKVRMVLPITFKLN